MRPLQIFLAIPILTLTVPGLARAQNSTIPPQDYVVEVTATRVPEAMEPVPVTITVVSGDQLRATGADDLATALATVSGVTIAPGGDSGPASSVPELWGLREFDAFLLVVDGVPWGGAFNPSLDTVDLSNIERIEVLRGPAPVMYGATSFVGVIQVIHKDAGAFDTRAGVSVGSYGSGSASYSTSLPATGSWQQSISIDGAKQGFKDDRTGFDRGHLLYRGGTDTAYGNFRLDFDASLLRQDPASPHPREGRVLSPDIPRDANFNPSGAHIDQNRYTLTLGHSTRLAFGTWATTLSWARADSDILRGFLTELDNPEENAEGYEQDRTVDDLYFDTHMVHEWGNNVRLVFGFDHLYGRGTAESGIFPYVIALDGSHPPSREDLVVDEETRIEDTRNFSGLYAQTEWRPDLRWRFDVGARLNRTSETRHGGPLDALTAEEEEGDEGGKDHRTITRGSGTVGASWLAWQKGRDALWLFANYRNAFKPAAIDFGPDAEGGILDPETSTSWEIGAKGNAMDDRLDWQVSAFRSDFDNLVVSQIRNGLPSLVNAGTERLEGIEAEGGVNVRPALRWQMSYAYHNAHFLDYERLFDGVPTQLRGNRLEMSPKHQAATSLIFYPADGWLGDLTVQYVGNRYMDKRNRALADAYTLVSAGVGYRFDRYQIRLDGDNLTDERPPVAESELGDAQYYLQPARNFRLSARIRF